MIAAVSVLLLALAPQERVAVHEDVQYAEVARQPRRNRLDLFVPQVEVPPPLVMFVHGGSWTGGRKERFARIGETLAGNGFACAVINTQLFPFARPDVMVLDCAHALGYLHRHGRDYGYDGDRLFVMGHSSGAHLCSWLAYDDRKLQLAGVPKRALRGAVLLSGVYDVRARHVALDGVFGLDARRRREASPWLYADEGDCPAYVAWAERELPGLSLCGQLLRDELLRRGVPVRSERYALRDHANYMFQFGTRRDQVTQPVLRFLRDPTAGGDAKARASRSAMLWIAADDRERQLGRALVDVCRPAGVEVVVQVVDDPDGERVTALYRGLRAARASAGRPPLRFAAGYGQGGLAVATSALTAETDGLAGRVLAAVPLADRSLRQAGRGPEAFRFLAKAPLLNLLGDQDHASLRADAWHRTILLVRDGCDASPVQLMGTTIETALRALDGEDDLLRPMLLTFLGAARRR
jgi:acetyl esterase/lipase